MRGVAAPDVRSLTRVAAAGPVAVFAGLYSAVVGGIRQHGIPKEVKRGARRMERGERNSARASERARGQVANDEGSRRSPDRSGASVNLTPAHCLPICRCCGRKALSIHSSVDRRGVPLGRGVVGSRSVWCWRLDWRDLAALACLSCLGSQPRPAKLHPGASRCSGPECDGGGGG
jgi:hypothetical protein